MAFAMKLPGFCLLAAIAWAQPVDPRTGRSEGRLRPRDEAPVFTLKRSGAESRVSLAQFRGKRPVALIFGSYT
jgi:hypothetical protein